MIKLYCLENQIKMILHATVKKINKTTTITVCTIKRSVVDQYLSRVDAHHLPGVQISGKWCAVCGQTEVWEWREWQKKKNKYKQNKQNKTKIKTKKIKKLPRPNAQPNAPQTFFDNFPEDLANISNRVASESTNSLSHSSWLIFFESKHFVHIDNTGHTFQVERSWLKDSANANISFMFVTCDTFHLDKSLSNEDVR